jgi:hypothetical protein
MEEKKIRRTQKEITEKKKSKKLRNSDKIKLLKVVW